MHAGLFWRCHNPPNSGMDDRIFNMRRWCFCMCIHMGGGWGDLGLLSHLKDVMDISMHVLDSSNPYSLQAEGHTHSCLWQRGGGGGVCSERLLLAEEKGSSVIVMGVCAWEQRTRCVVCANNPPYSPRPPPPTFLRWKNNNPLREKKKEEKKRKKQNTKEQKQ